MRCPECSRPFRGWFAWLQLAAHGITDHPPA